MLVRIGTNRYTFSRTITDATMQGIGQLSLFIEFGRAVTLQPTANQQFVETIEPSQATRLTQVNEGRMDGTSDG